MGPFDGGSASHNQGWKIGGDGINVVDRQTGDQIEVRFPRHTFQMNWGNRCVDIENWAPRTADLDLHTGDGSVGVEGVNRTILLRSGDVGHARCGETPVHFSPLGG